MKKNIALKTKSLSANCSITSIQSNKSVTTETLGKEDIKKIKGGAADIIILEMPAL